MEKFFEEVYKEAHLAETKFEVLKEDEVLRSKFDSFNYNYFNGALSIDKIGWSHHSSSRRLGACVTNGYETWIEISPLLKDHIETEVFKDVLVHEMIHILEPNHSQGFIQEMERINKDFGLHITVTVDTDSELSDVLEKFNQESLARRADKIINNKNKPELQSMYDELNTKYFEGKLPSDTIIKYLPSKTYKAYGLSKVRPDKDSDWVFELKVSRNDTKKNMLRGLIPLYVYGVLDVPKKQIDAESERLETEISVKTDNFTNI